MFSIPHMIVVFVIVLVVFGPQKLPELARGLGKLMAEFRKASTDFKSAFENEMRDLERQAQEVERKKRELLASVAALPQPATLATPSGAETQSGAPELATAPDKGATEAPLITPVAQSVARGSESPELSPETTVAGATEATVEASESHSVEPKADDGSDALAAPHDHKQPA
jgi:sec-independent protein translocase protein TatB